MTNKTMLKRTLSLGLAAVMSLSLLTGCGGGGSNGGGNSSSGGGAAAGGKEMTIKIGTVLTEESATGRALAELKKDLEATSGGRIKVEPYYGGVLGSADAVAEMVQAGDVQMMTQTPLGVEMQIPVLATLNQHYMFDDLDHAHRFLEGEGGQFMYDAWNSMEMQGLTTFALGFRELSNNKREVKSMADLKSLTLRGYSPVQIAAWQAVGATPTSVDWNELFVSMQQGLIDGQEGALSTINDFGFFEVQKYLTLTDHVFTCDMLVAGTTWLDTLSDEDRELIMASVDKAYEWHKEAYQAELSELIEKFKEKGMVITEMPDDMREEMREKMSAATEKEIVKVCGQEDYDKVMKWVEESRA